MKQVNVSHDVSFILQESFDEDELPDMYSWRVIFGDGKVSEWMGALDESVSHEYGEHGYFEVYLEVRDDSAAGGGEIVTHKSIDTVRVLPKVDPMMRNIAIVIFILAYVGIVSEKIDRTIMAMAGATLMVVVGVFENNDIGQ